MRTLRYSKGGDTQSKINTLQKLVDDKNTPETDRKNFQEAIKKFQEKLASETKAAEAEKPKPTSTAKTVAKKPIATAKPVSKPVAKPVAKPVVKKATVVAKPKKRLNLLLKKYQREYKCSLKSVLSLMVKK
jgi:DNA polymerase III delta prime subunit